MSQPSSTTADSPQPPPSDEALMQAIQRGDTKAFEELYDRYSPLLYPVCLGILHNAGDAQGVLLDLFWELWRSRERFNPERGSVRSYLMTLARSRAMAGSTQSIVLLDAPSHRLGLALHTQVKGARAGIRADRGDQDHVTDSGFMRGAGEIRDHLLVDRAEGLFRTSRAPGRPQGGNGDVAAGRAHEIGPPIRRRHAFPPGWRSTAGRTPDQRMHLGAARQQ